MKKVLIALLIAPTLVSAANRDATMSLISRYSVLNDIQASSSTVAPMEFSGTYEAELGLRMRSYFQFIVTGFQSTDNEIGGYGAGFRVDMPGFFFLGGPKHTGRYAKRNYPVNTSLVSTIVNVSVENADGTTGTDVGSNFGMGMDIYLFNKYVFFTAQASMLNIFGNAFAVYGYGLGAEF